MSAYGDTICEYCNESYHELEEHTCEYEVLKDRIFVLLRERDALQKEVERISQ